MSRISIATVCDLREQESSRVKTSVHVNETTHIEQLPNWTIGESFFWIALANAVTISTRQTTAILFAPARGCFTSDVVYIQRCI
jgi:hypothetical protein